MSEFYLQKLFTSRHWNGSAVGNDKPDILRINLKLFPYH